MNRTTDDEQLFLTQRAFRRRLEEARKAGGQQEVVAFRKKLCAITKLSPVQLSRFEHSRKPNKIRESGRFVFEIVASFIGLEITESSDQQTKYSPIHDVKDNFFEELKKLYIRFSSEDPKYIEELHRALLHFGMYKYGQPEQPSLKFNPLFLDHQGGYRIITPHAGSRDAEPLVSVSGLYIDKSPYVNMALFMEVAGKLRNKVVYKGICYSIGDPDALTHNFLGFSGGRMQLMLMQSDTIRGEIWLQGTRILFDPKQGPLASSAAGYYMGKTLECFRRCDVETVADFVKDPQEQFREKLLGRLNFDQKWTRGDLIINK